MGGSGLTAKERPSIRGTSASIRAEGIEEEAVDLTVAFHPNLTCKIFDMTRTKALDTSHGPVLSAQKWQSRDDSVMARMFSMEELQLRIGGHPVIDEKLETLVDRYPLIEIAAFLCRLVLLFLSCWMMMKLLLMRI
ncbi:hypothetical protein H5410_040692 [Solanum commersonii]|uniref:Uncharacterized protein n=1 Tax=Solanum commersonii TaxID=4109 RepID=A0A9J5XQW1_SOLCO|nr:hypothetical protein H5410_040692 [Solanum commersonii]